MYIIGQRNYITLITFSRAFAEISLSKVFKNAESAFRRVVKAVKLVLTAVCSGRVYFALVP
jgi:hypothetical protein